MIGFWLCLLVAVLGLGVWCVAGHLDKKQKACDEAKAEAFWLRLYMEEQQQKEAERRKYAEGARDANRT